MAYWFEVILLLDFPKVKLFGITVIQSDNIDLFLSLTFFFYKSLLEV